jgi:hypothetical protein
MSPRAARYQPPALFSRGQADDGEGTVRIRASTFENNADQDVNIDGVTVIGWP